MLGRLQPNLPWQCLYFLPEPHGQGSLRPTLPQLAGFFGSRSATRSNPLRPLGADGTSETSASAISSSPVVGSTLWASMYGRLACSSGGGACRISTRISWAVTASRRLALIDSNRLNASALYSLSGSRWP